MSTGKIPESMNIGKFIPIPKDQKEPITIDNILSITIFDTMTIIFEKVLMSRILRTHTANELQFGFKANSSCNHAVHTLMEIAKDLNEKGERCYTVAIDASKAFDKVNREKLLSKLRKTLDPHTWIALRNYYAVKKFKY